VKNGEPFFKTAAFNNDDGNGRVDRSAAFSVAVPLRCSPAELRRLSLSRPRSETVFSLSLSLELQAQDGDENIRGYCFKP